MEQNTNCACRCSALPIVAELSTLDLNSIWPTSRVKERLGVVIAILGP